jgi:hypothetical protein
VTPAAIILSLASVDGDGCTALCSSRSRSGRLSDSFSSGHHGSSPVDLGRRLGSVGVCVRQVPVAAACSSGSDLPARSVAVDGRLRVVLFYQVWVWWLCVTWTEVWWHVLRATSSPAWCSVVGASVVRMCAREVRVTRNADGAGAEVSRFPFQA